MLGCRILLRSPHVCVSPPPLEDAMGGAGSCSVPPGLCVAAAIEDAMGGASTPARFNLSPPLEKGGESESTGSQVEPCGSWPTLCSTPCHVLHPSPSRRDSSTPHPHRPEPCFFSARHQRAYPLMGRSGPISIYLIYLFIYFRFRRLRTRLSLEAGLAREGVEPPSARVRPYSQHPCTQYSVDMYSRHIQYVSVSDTYPYMGWRIHAS
jgi:hypothetical protein